MQVGDLVREGQVSADLKLGIGQDAVGVGNQIPELGITKEREGDTAQGIPGVEVVLRLAVLGLLENGAAGVIDVLLFDFQRTTALEGNQVGILRINLPAL